MALNEETPPKRPFQPGLAAFPRGTLARGLLLSLRPKQWTKNGLLFIGLIFALKLGQLDLVVTAVLAFVDFCALASATYLINDLADIENDRSHPKKRQRPIASGWVPRGVAVATAVLLLSVGLPFAFTINVSFGLLAVAYVALTLAYTYHLKHVVILDVFGLAAGFVLRAVAGAVAIDVPISPWLYVCTILGALFLGIGKRRHELLLLNSAATNHRPILQQYTTQLLDQMIGVVTAALVMAYSLYTFLAAPQQEQHAMMLTIPFVLYGIFRYLYLVHVNGDGGSPEEVLLRDRPLLIDGLLWLASSIVILYYLH